MKEGKFIIWKDDGDPNTKNGYEINLERALEIVEKLPTSKEDEIQSYIEFYNPEKMGFSLNRSAKNKWFLSVLIDLGHPEEGQDGLTTEDIKNITKRFFEGEDIHEDIRKIKLERIKKILEFEAEKGREITKEEMIKLDFSILEYEEYMKLLEEPVDYDPSKSYLYSNDAEKVFRRNQNPTLYDLVCGMGFDLNMAKKIGIYLRDQKLIKYFPRFPSKSAASELWVEVDGTKYYVREKDGYSFLDLSYINISDITEIQGLDKLKDLEHLNLRDNEIKEIKGLDSLTNLKRLDLTYNNISELKNLNNQLNLMILWLSCNQITEIKGLDNLTELFKLALASNKITKITGLDKLTKLNKLYLNNNLITEITGLDNLTSLAELDLSTNWISEIKGLEKLNRLTKLWLNDNPVYKSVKKKFGIVKLGRYFKDPQLLVKWCQLNDPTEIQKLASLYDKITFEEIASKFETDIKEIKSIIEDMIVNGVLNANISGDTLVFQKAVISEPTVKTEQTQVEEVSEAKKGKLVFISYATKDAVLFKISKIAEELTKFEEIDDILYWQEDMHDNIIKYMNDNLGNCNVMLLFCSPNALKSVPVEKEWTAADALGKPIIPVFIKTEHIPPLLSSRLGIEYDTFDFQKNIKNLYDLILKKSL